MNPLIAFCGLDCASCEVRTATLHNDTALRTRVAQEWSALNHTNIRPEDINCTGCPVWTASRHPIATTSVLSANVPCSVASPIAANVPRWRTATPCTN